MAGVDSIESRLREEDRWWWLSSLVVWRGVCCGTKRKGLCRSCVCDVLYTRRLEIVDEGSIEGVKERGILIRMERFGKLKVVSVHLL